MTRKYLSCAETAKLVRAAPKENFPTTKFHVRSSVYSGGVSIHIDYIDGPPPPRVEAIVKRFEGASFDGMIDLKSYHTSIWQGEEVHFGADYIFVEHEYTPDRKALIEAVLDGKWGGSHWRGERNLDYWRTFREEAEEHDFSVA